MLPEARASGTPAPIHLRGTLGGISLILITVYLLLALLSTVVPAQVEPFASEYEKYRILPNEKAFAIALDEGGAWVCGYGYGARDLKEAETLALAECRKRAREFLVASPCEVIALGDTRIRAPSRPSSGGGVTYEVRWVNGTSFVIGTAGDLQLWVAFTAGRDPQGLFYLVNGSDDSITFSPDTIEATSTQSDRKGPRQSPVEVYSAGDYEKKVRTKQAWQAALYGAAVAMANQPQPRTNTFEGDYTSQQTFHPGSQVNGTFQGQIISWPTADDHAAARERSSAQISSMGGQLEASYQAMAESLLRTHTLAPGTYYGGIVHFSRIRGKKISLEIPFGNERFRVYFTLP